MKKYYLLLLGILSTLSIFGQSKAISYQAVILDPNQIEIPGQNISGQPLSNGAVCIKFTILNANGSVDYEETQSTQTDEFGLVSLTIGKKPEFNTLKWDANRKSLKVSVSFDNCSTYKVTTVEKLSYSPYAMYAGAVDYQNVDGAPTSLSQFKNDAGFLIPKDLDPLKKDILLNQTNLTNLSDQTTSKFGIVNQQIAVLDSSNKNTNKKFAAIDTTISGINTRITSNETSIKQTNNYVNQQVGGLQTQINTTNTSINQLGVTYEVISNKSDDANLGAGSPSSVLYPTQLAVKSYVDQSVQDAVASGAPDATTLAKGKVKLAGDLGGTADLPTVPALSLKESLSNKSTSVSTDGSSDTKYPSAKAVKDYVDASVSGVAFQSNLDAKADKNSPVFTGTPSMPTGTTGVTQSNTDNSTKLATTAFVQNAISAGVIDATTTDKGKIQLAGDLGGTAASPTVPGLANKAPLASPAFTGTPTAPTATIGTNTTQIATTAFVTTAMTNASVADATTTDKGKIQLAGDLGGTAASPTVPGLANKENTITAGTTAQYYRGDKSWQTLDKSAVGLGNVDNTSDANKPVSTATQTALDLKAPLASAAFTGTPTAPTATAGTNTTQIATTAFVTNALTSASIADADATTKGKIQLAGDLGGTAASPTVPGLANKENTITAGTTAQYYRGDKSWQTLDKSAVGLANVDNTSDANKPVSTATQTALDLKAPLASAAFTGTPTAPTATAGTNTTQLATTAFVTNALTSASIADADATTKGKIQLAGDLGGTAASPTVPGLANKENTITAGTTAQYYRGDKSWQTLDKSAVGLANVDNTSDANKPVSTATQTALDLKAPLASAAFTGTPTAPTATAGTNTTQIATTAFVTNAVSNGLSLGNIESSSTAKGATLTSGVLKLAPADGTNPGIVTTGTQTFEGDKTFKSSIIGNTVLKVGSGLTTPGALDGFTSGSTTYPSPVAGIYGPMASGSESTLLRLKLPINYGSSIQSLADFVMSGGNKSKLTIKLGNQNDDNFVNALTMMNAASGSNPLVGINNTSPSSTLDVTGTAAFSGNTSIGGTLDVTGEITNTNLTASKGVFTDANKKLTSTGTLGLDQGGLGVSSITAGQVVFGNTSSAIGTSGNLKFDNTNSILKVGPGVSLGDAESGFYNGGATYPTTPILGVYGPAATTSETTLLRLKRTHNQGTSYQAVADFVMEGGNKSKLSIRLGNENDNNFINALTMVGAPASDVPYIGINKTSPTKTLDISGTLGVSGATTIGGDLTISSGTPGVGKVLTSDANGLATWSTPSSGGVTTIGSVAGSSTANAASISGSTLSLAPADGSNPGIVTTGAQTFAGAKTFSSDITVNGTPLGLGNGAVTTNIKFGRSALNSNSTGGYLVAIGTNALSSNSTGSHNIAIGGSTLLNNDTGGSLIAMGTNALMSNSTGLQSIAIGTNAFMNNTTGGTSVAVGVNALNNIQTGSRNVAIGHSAGTSLNGSENNNTFLGYYADGASGISNAMALGYNSTVNASNKIQLGNSSVTSVATSGKLTTGTITFPNTDGTSGQVLSTNGSGTISWSTPSSGGVTTIGSVAGSSTANGASISGTTLSLAPADGTNPGIVTTGTQTFAGTKTFSSTITGSISGNAGTVTNGVYTTNKLSALAATTSSELAGVISDETGSGTLVFASSPTLVTPTLGVATATSINKVAITAPASSATLTIADGKTLTASDNATVSGTNTGDQTITLTGDVTGSGTGSFATTIGAGKVTSSMLAATAIVEVSDEITATAAQTSFTITHAKGPNRTIKMFINGVRISNTAYSDSSTTITYTKANNGGYELKAGDRIQFDYSY